MLGSQRCTDIYRATLNDGIMKSCTRVRVLVHSWLPLMRASVLSSKLTAYAILL
jgi:hypothetical protein